MKQRTDFTWEDDDEAWEKKEGNPNKVYATFKNI